jgi:hypothetical protein
MSTFFLTSIITVSAIIIIKLLIENNKLKNNTLNNSNEHEVSDKEYIESIRPLIRIPNNNIDSVKTTSQTLTKNSFLHGADSFGEMKKGVVLDGKTYTHDDDKDASFKIQPAPKKGEIKNNILFYVYIQQPIT